MITKVRVRAEIDDELEVEHDEGASDEEIFELAHADWTFTEASSWSEEIV